MKYINVNKSKGLLKNGIGTHIQKNSNVNSNILLSSNVFISNINSKLRFDFPTFM